MIENRNGFIRSLHKKSWTVSNVCTNILTTIQMTMLQVCLFFYLNLSIFHDLIYYLCAFHNLCSPVSITRLSPSSCGYDLTPAENFLLFPHFTFYGPTNGRTLLKGRADGHYWQFCAGQGDNTMGMNLEFDSKELYSGNWCPASYNLYYR